MEGKFSTFSKDLDWHIRQKPEAKLTQEFWRYFILEASQLVRAGISLKPNLCKIIWAHQVTLGTVAKPSLIDEGWMAFRAFSKSAISICVQMRTILGTKIKQRFRAEQNCMV